MAVAKLLAGRPKDFEWIKAAMSASLIERRKVEALLAEVDSTQAERELALARVGRLEGEL